MDLKNKLIVVTGASSGIGEALSRSLHSHGAKLLLVARRKEHLARISEELNRIRPDTCSYLVADLSSIRPDGDIEGVLEVENFLAQNEVELLINNAGFGSFGYFEKLDIERESQMVALNVLSYMRLTHAVLPGMKTRKSGAIIFVSSIAAFQPLPYMSTYAATKAFDLVFANGIRHEVKEFGINVLSVCPGPTATEFGGVARVPGELTNVGRDSVDLVVRQTIQALMQKRAIVVTGARSKFLAFFSRYMPLDLTTAITRRALLPSLQVLYGNKK